MPIHNLIIGVKELIDTLYHQENLGAGAPSAQRAMEGMQGHRLIRDRRPAEYRSETPIEFNYDWEDYRLTIRGRIDGLMETATELEVEEIKTTYSPLNELTLTDYPSHSIQLQLYLYFLQVQHPEKTVSGKLTYLNLDDLAEKSFRLYPKEAEGAVLLSNLAVSYLSGIKDRDLWRQQRNHSLENWAFPFPELRSGQSELIETVNQALESETTLFLEAATGIGKTIGVLYPALKRLVTSNRYDQIFLLTAKTAGKEIVKKTLIQAKNQGIRLRTVFIEAKERVCLHPGTECQPESCPCALGYYVRIKQVLPIILTEELILPEQVANYAAAHELCPFELSLDLALFADLIVCDYNYVFDPSVYLKRFFLHSGRQDFLFLVDEAHNLVQRGREMYSAKLTEDQLEQLRLQLSGLAPRAVAIIGQLTDFFTQWRQQLTEDNRQGMLLSHLPELFEPTLAKLTTLLERWLSQSTASGLTKSVRDSYFELLRVLRTISLLRPEYALYILLEKDNLVLRLFCRNPAPLLRQRLKHARSTVFFSATLSPPKYFQTLLAGDAEALSLQLTSPFPQENRLYLHVPGIDTRYRQREASAGRIAQIAVDLATARKGNYLVFFPSYTYLNKVRPLIQQLAVGKCDVVAQFPAMNERQKHAFLERVTATDGRHSNLGLAVLGGLFGEGIDLPGEALVGVMLVGPGLPAISAEQELIQAWFQEQENAGFLYAYVIPGLIRVIQSAGRVFRGPDDRGVVLMVDDRFLQEEYQALLPPDWFLACRPFSQADYRETLAEFWNDQ